MRGDESSVKGGGSGGNGGVDGVKGGGAGPMGDRVGKDGGDSKSHVSSRVSFRDKVMGGAGSSKPTLKDALGFKQCVRMMLSKGDV